MQKLNTSNFHNSLEYLIAGSVNQNDLEEFKAILEDPEFSYLSKEHIGNAAFLAAYFGNRKNFINYLILEKKIPYTNLISGFVTVDIKQIFSIRNSTLITN